MSRLMLLQVKTSCNMLENIPNLIFNLQIKGAWIFQGLFGDLYALNVIKHQTLVLP